MLNFDEREEARMDQEAFAIEAELQALNERRNQVIMVTAAEYARAAQYRSLLITLQTAVQPDTYALERVAAAVVTAFEKLEGAGC